MGVKKEAAKAYLAEQKAKQEEAENYMAALPWAIGFAIGIGTIVTILGMIFHP